VGAGPRLTLADWNEALLDALLPATRDQRRPALLACDDAALARIATDLGLNNPEHAAAELVAALQAEQPVDDSAGFAAVLAEAQAFAVASRPRAGPPPHLAALCLTVLAASRMDYTDEHTTGAYYTHLCDLLDVPPREQWPHIPRFDELIDAFGELADWLADDQNGARGHLLLPRENGRRYVGVPISQTVLRGRDRYLLGDFFWRYRRSLDAGFSPPRLLRLWGGRHQLTGPAQERIADRRLDRALTAAVAAAYRTWDGTRRDSGGSVIHPVALRLGANPTRVALHASLPGLPGDHMVIAPDGQPFQLAAHPQETIVPLNWLEQAIEAPLRLALSGGDNLVEVLDSPTMLFEMTDVGLLRVSLAAGAPVWALTCDPALTGLQLPPNRVHRAQLPAGWKLLVGLAEDELPADLTAPERDPDAIGTADDVQLVGGLRLLDGAWLVDHPPGVSSHLPEPALITIDGVEHGDIEPDQIRQLYEIVHDPGVHVIDVGDVWDAEIELAARGPRHGIGEIMWDLGHPTLVRHGPTGDQHSLRCRGATVVGAIVSGGPTFDWHAPLLIRTRGTVHAIRVSGAVTAHAPAAASTWERQAGLDRPGRAWGIDDDGTIVWLCAEHPQRPRVIRVRDLDVAVTEDVLDCAYEFAEAVVIDQSGGFDATSSWRELVEESFRDD
jgi:hypothetical protein